MPKGSKRYLCFSNPGHPNDRQNLTLRLTCDGGLTWPHVLPVHDGYSGYSDLVAFKVRNRAKLSRWNIACLYECERDDVKSICFKIVPIKDLNPEADAPLCSSM